MKTHKLKEILQLHKKWLEGYKGRKADLRDANLRDVRLRRVVGDGERIKTVQSKWHIAYTEDIMAIGCQQHTLEDWFSFPDSRISRMGVDSLRWWKEYKPILKVITGINMIVVRLR